MKPEIMKSKNDSTLHISHVIVESLLLILSRKIFARNSCYESPSTLEQNDVIALLSLFLILNIFHPCPSASVVNFEYAFNCWV